MAEAEVSRQLDVERVVAKRLSLRPQAAQEGRHGPRSPVTPFSIRCGYRAGRTRYSILRISPRVE